MPVVINPQPNHVPTRMVGVSDAKNRECGGSDRITRAPEKRECSALRINIARRPPAELLQIAAAQPRAPGTIRNFGDLRIEVWCNRPVCGDIGGRSLFSGQVK